MSRILYVEDDATLQVDGEACLAAAGYDVVLASDGASACAYLNAHDAQFDGLVTDVELPGGVDGWEIAELGREITRDLPVIYVSGVGRFDFLKRGVPHSVMVPKPFNWARVVTSLSELLPAAA